MKVLIFAQSICSSLYVQFQSDIYNFLRNVSETTKEGGYFMGTSYDGNKIFKMLE